MPKEITSFELETALSAVAKHPSGMTIAEITQELNPGYTRRTLQRRLATLAEQNRLVVVGKGAATQYKIPPAHELRIMEKDSSYVPANIQLSNEAMALQEIVRRPANERKSVGYNRDFLNAYDPGKTWYLPLEIRAELHRLNQWREQSLPPGTYARKIYSRLLIDLSWNSSRLEGNSYSLLETDRLLNLGKTAEGKELAETLMLLNHKAAIELMVDEATEIDFNRYTVLNLHALLSQDLLKNEDAVGRVRTIPVGISSSVYNPLAVPQVIDECFQQILDTAAAITDPFEQAFFVMVHLPYLQPFEDVNKRTSRLAANIPLIKNNYCPLSFVNMSDRLYIDGMLAVYELNRIELLREVFVFAYGHSCSRYSTVARELGEPDWFRVQHRQLIKSLAANVVRGGMDKESAAQYIRAQASREVSEFEQAKLIEMVETDLMAMHEGKLAVYRLRPSEYCEWQKTWH